MPKVLIEIGLPFDADLGEPALRQHAAAQLGLEPDQVQAAHLRRRALDARRRLPKPMWSLTLEVETPVALVTDRARPVPEPAPEIEVPRAPISAGPIVVVGAGPAGLFCAWHLAEQGARVVLLERGKPVETRARDCGRLRGKGVLDPESNLCFGEGGAGTYSDGKLTCRRKGPRIREVLHRLVEAGAPPQILVDAKPHIGTNKLFGVLKGIRHRLLEHGVDIRFGTRFERLKLSEGRVVGVESSAGIIDAEKVVLALGHSARDTYETLLSQGLPIEPKPFAVGVRIEHPQTLIDSAQYRMGPNRPAGLPPADYRLSHQHEGVASIHSVCVPAAWLSRRPRNPRWPSSTACRRRPARRNSPTAGWLSRSDWAT